MIKTKKRLQQFAVILLTTYFEIIQRSAKIFFLQVAWLAPTPRVTQPKTMILADLCVYQVNPKAQWNTETEPWLCRSSPTKSRASIKELPFARGVHACSVNVVSSDSQQNAHLSVRRFTRSDYSSLSDRLTSRPIRKFAIFTRQPTENLPGIIISILHTTGVLQHGWRRPGQGLTRDGAGGMRGEDREGGREI